MNWKQALIGEGKRLGLALLSVGLVTLAGAAFFLGRDHLGRQFDKGSQDPSTAVRVVPQSARSQPTSPEEKWSRRRVVNRLQASTESLDLLISTGRDELPDFIELSSGDETDRKLYTARWRSWRRIWLNRARVAESGLVPVEQCSRFADLTDRCGELRTIVSDLVSIALAKEVQQAIVLFEQCRALLAPRLELSPKELGSSVPRGPERGSSAQQDSDQMGNE